ncbi:hypothetical protein L484_027624 [Morus notabilis]|uniref:Uncharacterized protein n=1 Tax=Morus notabilis TaxID=981085 RepID=W9RKH3_9ROSA|nr:hypothetical protein L484_027624 [Morus notabilis]
MVKVGKGVSPLLEGRFLALLWVFQSPPTAPPPASSSSEVYDRDARRSSERPCSASTTRLQTAQRTPFD